MTFRTVLSAFGIAVLAATFVAPTASANDRGPKARAQRSYQSGAAKAQLRKEFAAGHGVGGGGTAWSTPQSIAARQHIEQKYTSLVRTSAQREMVLHVATLSSFPEAQREAAAVKLMTDTLARRNAQAGLTRTARLTKQDRYLLTTMVEDANLRQPLRDRIANAIQ